MDTNRTYLKKNNMATNILDIGEIYKGDYFEIFPIRITEGGDPVDLTGAEIKIQFRAYAKNGKVLYTAISTGSTPTITITDADDGQFQIEGFLLNWPVGIHYFSCLITIDSKPRTYFEGKIKVIQNITVSSNG
jgi:hypothetical protein